MGEDRAVAAHRIVIEPIAPGERGHRYRVAFRGTTLIESSRVPGLDACRAQLALGFTGKLEMWRPGKAGPDMQLDIERAAKLTVVETEKAGPYFASWQPFSPGTQEAVLSRTHSPLAGANDFRAPTPT
jgi:hypothetical protein